MKWNLGRLITSSKLVFKKLEDSLKKLQESQKLEKVRSNLELEET